MRRMLIALAVTSATVLGAQAPAVADTNCGRLVCAHTEAAAHFECEVAPSPMGGQVAECFAVTLGIASGSSPVMVPGSAEWSVSADCTWSSGGGLFGCGHNDRDPQVCSWAGLGENGCGGRMDETFGPIQIPLPPGECIGQRLRATDSDVIVSALASSAASKGLPLVGQVDQASSNELATIHLSDIPDGDDTCARP